MPQEIASRRKRAHGEESRRRILDATVDVASERGYEGTSIALVSKKCGLPASSIYWHFKDKDDLIAAVIERSFGSWLGAMSVPDGPNPRDRVTAMSMQIAKGLLETPDFLRLGLMLALEHRPVEAKGRIKFLEVRRDAHARVAEAMRQFAPGMATESVDLLTTYAIAAADGLFIAGEIGGGDVDLLQLFELHGTLVYEAALRLTNRNPEDTEEPS
ncbi:TetR/AcrR family transcriptional regulator [Rhodococcus fascians]|nr:TetR/AcrR family transcriptional regulator [Rhodococcus fascians]MBY4237871.1 TetR/AcrR family transcriptional regulator [Rhodococcus fascians]MBY4253378.1 TetR/AcrR family transcriptional regulator [Rhodococcus fascians]MBY4269015.1 TetR/AcrR family transcriptional regulator [Rhodococcus fascians]MBY4275068.1 TetR/AcrR family transcriptional regulator [Rhodococcus fascians]